MFNMASIGFVVSCLLVSFLMLEVKSQSNFVTVACEKSDIVAEYGTSTLLNCVVRTQASDAEIQHVSWSLNKVTLLTFHLGTVHPSKPGFQFAKSTLWGHSNMNVSLLITKTDLSHTGDYACEVVTDRGDSNSEVHLTVKSNYSKPMIDSDPEKIIPDKDFTLTCNAHSGYPKGDIRWVVNDVAWKKNPIVEDEKNSNGLYDLTSKLSFGPNSPFTKFVCEVYSAEGVKEGQETFDILHKDLIKDTGKKGHSVTQIVAPAVVIGSLIVGLLVAVLVCRRRQQNVPARCPEEEMVL